MKKIVLTVVAVLLISVGLSTSMRMADAAGGDPVISGTGRVGETLTITSYGSLGGAPSDFTYTWLWEGEEVPGPKDYDVTHTVTTADLGRELSVLVKPKRIDGDRLASNRIRATDAALAAPAVAVTGSPRVGGTLSATISGGTPGAALAIQWLRDGAAIPGATGTAYRVVKADGGRAVSVRATSSQPGKASVSRDADVRRVAAFNVSRPRLKGAPRVGRTLKVRSRGAWLAPGHAYSYQWMRNGSKISRATKTSYKLTAKDRRKRITVVVRVRKSGFPTVSAGSARSAKIH